MRVSEISALNRKRRRVTFETEEGSVTFALYAGELHRFHLTEGELVEDTLVSRIEKEILLKRAKERCMYLLGRRDYTAYELEKKLRDGYYPDRVIEKVLACLSEYHLIDDAQYAKRYAQANCCRKSAYQIRMELRRKGIADALISDAQDPDREEEALTGLVARRCGKTSLEDPKEWRKQCAYLLGKGFPYERVRSALEAYRVLQEV